MPSRKASPSVTLFQNFSQMMRMVMTMTTRMATMITGFHYVSLVSLLLLCGCDHFYAVVSGLPSSSRASGYSSRTLRTCSFVSGSAFPVCKDSGSGSSRMRLRSLSSTCSARRRSSQQPWCYASLIWDHPVKRANDSSPVKGQSRSPTVTRVD